MEVIYKKPIYKDKYYTVYPTEFKDKIYRNHDL